jgi:hypothetical protein
MTSFASGPGKVLTINEESVFGTLVASGGTSLDRVESTIALTKDTYNSNAIRKDAQKVLSRHGMRKVGGDIKGELNPGAYSLLMAGLLRRDFVTGPTTGAVAVIATTNTTFHRSAGSFLTNGFKIGSVVAASGFTSTAASVNGKRMLVTNVTTSDLTLLNMDGSATTLGVHAEGDTVTVAEVGKVTYTPSTGHTDKSYSIEHWHSDISVSHAFVGSKIGSMDIALPTTGLATVTFGTTGRERQKDTVQQLTSPSSPSEGRGLSSVNGVILIGGTPVGILNSLSFKVDNQLAVDGVVGSNLTPFVWQGVQIGSGQIVAFFQDATFDGYFDQETEIGIIALLTDQSGTGADFMAITLPRVKINGATSDDKQTGGLKLTGNIEFLRNTAGGAGTTSEDTTIRIQDSLAA